MKTLPICLFVDKKLSEDLGILKLFSNLPITYLCLHYKVIISNNKKLSIFSRRKLGFPEWDSSVKYLFLALLLGSSWPYI